MAITLRPNTADAFAFKEVFIDQCYKRLTLSKDDIVLDIWWHIGAFSIYASPLVSKIVTYEPDPWNYIALRWNIEWSTNIEIHNEAVAQETWITWYYMHPQFSWMNTTTETEWYQYMKVPCRSFKEIIDTVKPTKIKIDCEGGEYDFLTDFQFPEYVKEIIMETHFEKNEWKVKYPKMVLNLIKQFKVDQDINWIIGEIYASR